MPNINAAIGCAQLEQLSKKVAQKRVLANLYFETFKKMDGVKIFKELNYAKSNYWLNTLIFDNASIENIDNILTMLNKHNILARPAWSLMHHLPMYMNCPRMELSVCEKLFSSMINLPSTAELMERI